MPPPRGRAVAQPAVPATVRATCGTAAQLEPSAPHLLVRMHPRAARASEGRLASEAGRGKARPGGPGCARCALCAHADTALTNTATFV